jgi:hypothetical protein
VPPVATPAVPPVPPVALLPPVPPVALLPPVPPVALLPPVPPVALAPPVPLLPPVTTALPPLLRSSTEGPVVPQAAAMSEASETSETSLIEVLRMGLCFAMNG